MKVLLGEDEESLLPPGEELVPLLPQEALLDEGVSIWCGVPGAAGGKDGVAIVVLAVAQ